MGTIVLVHGACHGAWCWDAVVPVLRAAGHGVVTPDLPSDDPDAGLADYADVVERAIGYAAREVVLVGHSLGALTVPVVAARRPVDALVFLAGIVGAPGRSLADLAEIDAGRDGVLDDGDTEMFESGTFCFTEKGAMRALYHDCPVDVASEAVRRLRPQRSLWHEVLPIATWPSTRIESIVCTEDRIVNRAWAERTARERLGVEPVLIGGGHSPMLSRPAELAETIGRLARP